MTEAEMTAALDRLIGLDVTSREGQRAFAEWRNTYASARLQSRDLSRPTADTGLKRRRQSQGIPHGCHVELEDGQWADGCVLDYGAPGDCIEARGRRCRETCKWWQALAVDRAALDAFAGK